jgi:hypothetical protein
VVLRYPADAAVLIAGVPGAGKSTLAARLGRRDGVRVLDTDPLREQWARALGPFPYRLWRPALHTAHLVRIWRALGRPGPLVVAEPATRPRVRRILLRRTRRAGRTLHLLGIDAGVAEARGGQLARGRTIRPASLERHARRWARARAQARHEGFATVRLLTRPHAAAVAALAFGAESGPWSSRTRSWSSPEARPASGVRSPCASPRRGRAA